MSEASSETRSSSLPGWLRSGTALAVALFVLAAFFRLTDLQARNLWTDEAWVALAALKDSPAEVLAAGQSTPPFYLLAVWALARVFGGSEAVLRSLSFCFGLGTVLLFYPLARLLATASSASLLGLAAMTFSPIMVYFSKELKQYSGDAFLAVAVLLMTERLRLARGEKGWLALGLAGALGLGFSHSLVFVLPVALAALWLSLPPLERRRTIVLAACWGAAFAALYFFFFRHQVDPELVGYWSQDFPDFSSPAAFLWWLGGAFSRYFEYFLGPWGIFWGTPLFALGVSQWLRDKQFLPCLYLAGPLLLAFGAAAVHRYPFMAHYGGSRLMLFSAPMLYLAVAVGSVTAFLFLWRRRSWRWLALLAAGGVLVSLRPLEILQENLHPSFNRSQLKPLVQYLQQRMAPRDLIYVYYYAIHPFKYYYQSSLEHVYWGKSCVETGLHLNEDDDEDDEDEDTDGPARRLWLISGHYPSLAYMDAFAAKLLGPDWQQTLRLEAPGAILYRFERRPAAAAKTRAPRPEPAGSGPPAPVAGRAYK